MNKISTVIFDLDGTLLNTLEDIAEAGNLALTMEGLPVYSVDAYRSMVGNGIPVLVRRMLGDDADEARFQRVYDAFMAYYNEHMNDHTAPYSGAGELLERLKGAGYTLAVLSNKDDAMAGPIVESYFPGVFDMVRGFKEGFPHKPDPASLLDMMRRMGVKKDEVLFCGDSGVDVRTGKSAGLRVCGVLWGFRDKDELLAEGADCLAEDFYALGRVIGV